MKAIKIRTDKTEVDLEKSGAGAWRWVGRADFRVRADRVEELLRQLKQARITDFPLAAPKDLQAAGLAPQAKTEVTLMTPQGAEPCSWEPGPEPRVYARLGPQGQVVKVGKGPAGTGRPGRQPPWKTAACGPVPSSKWGRWCGEPRVRTGPRCRTPDFWKITGPDKAEVKQDSQRLQLALINFQNLEYSSLLPQAGAPGKEAFTVEFYDLAGKPMFHLDELAKKGDSVEVLTKSGNTTMAAAVPQKNFTNGRRS